MIHSISHLPSFLHQQAILGHISGHIGGNITNPLNNDNKPREDASRRNVLYEMNLTHGMHPVL